MTTGIISLVLLVLMATVMYFVRKIYSVLRAVESNLTAEFTILEWKIQDTERGKLEWYMESRRPPFGASRTTGAFPRKTTKEKCK